MKIDLQTELPVDMDVSNAKKHESKYLTNFARQKEVLVADRDYSSYKDFTTLKKFGRIFVIRLKNNVILHDENNLIIEDEDNVTEIVMPTSGQA
ncbi:transposase [Hazenella sp. IB182353]|uniref:transposase n=1 Tax=Polycladospora coralii TaxID=2771432 RepID=UPI0017460459|nr:transposase [Polycladospora coralii]